MGNILCLEFLKVFEILERVDAVINDKFKIVSISLFTIIWLNVN
jgi:hypothetical protein